MRNSLYANHQKLLSLLHIPTLTIKSNFNIWIKAYNKYIPGHKMARITSLSRGIGGDDPSKVCVALLAEKEF